MKNKKGRPRCNDENTLLAVARKIKANHGITVRSAIVQCLPEYSDANIRRVQRKWRNESTHYLNKISNESPRVIDRTHIGVPRSYFTVAQELQDSLERMTAPMRHFQEMQERLRIDMPAIESAKRLAAALQPSVGIAMEQYKLLNIRSPFEDSALMQAVKSLENMAKQFQMPQIGVYA